MKSIETLYLIHHTHTDVGFTHDQDVVLDLHYQFIDRAIELCEQTADYPEGSALRWTCECTLPLLNWLKKRTDSRIERLLKLEAAGRIEVTGMFATLSQCLSHEATWRQLYPVSKLRSDYGMTIRSAMACDINGVHWGLVDALADAGLANFAMAINENVGRAAFGTARPNGFHWKSAAGRQVLVWNGLHYNNNQYFGIPDDFDRAVRELPRFLDWLEQRHYPYPFCLFQATHNTFNDNGPPDARLADFVRRWNREGRTPRMEIVTLSAFFDRLRCEPAELLPPHQGDWSDYWNFGATSSAYETALNRGTERRLVEAEWLSAFAPPDEEFSRKPDLVRGWELALLYDEHTWCANVSVAKPWSNATRSQLNQKLNYAYRARSRAQLVRLEAVDRLARSISAPAGRYVLAINSLRWPRREPLELPAAWLEGYSSLPPQLVEDENAPRTTITHEVHDTVSRVQYLDRDDLGEQQSLADAGSLLSIPVEVPAMGYRLCSAADLQARIPERPHQVDEARAENDYLIVALDARRGGVASLFEKTRAREWIDRDSAWPLGGYVYEEVTTAKPDQPYGGRMEIFQESDWSRFMGYRGWNVNWPARRRGASRVISQTCQRLPGATRLRQICNAPGLNQLVYELTLHDDRPSVDLRITLDKTWSLAPENCYLIFPFDLPGAVPRYEAVGGVVTPSENQLPGSNQDFPTIQGWADWSTDREGMTLCTPDAPIMLFGGFHFGRMHDGERPVTPSILSSLIMSNLWHVNYAPAQHGLVTFSYRLCPHGAFDSAWSSRQAREAACPLWSHPVKDPNGPRSTTSSLFEVDPPSVDVTACKPADNGDGLFVRLRNTSANSLNATLYFPEGNFKEAWACDGLEEKQHPIPFAGGKLNISFPPFSTQGYRLA